MSMQKFCPKCGKHSEELVEGLCYNCYSLAKELVDIPANINISICKCGRAKEMRGWKDYGNFESLIHAVVMGNAKIEPGASAKLIFDKKVPSGKATVAVDVHASKKLKEMKISQESRALVTVTPQLCDFCARQRGNYYEGIIQIRGNAALWNELRNFIFSFMEKCSSAGRKSQEFITKEEHLKEGINIYIGSMKQAFKLLTEAKKRFDLETDQNYKLWGEKDGKSIKRATILLRLK